MSWLTARRSACTFICPEDRYVAKASLEYPYEYVPGEGRMNAQNSFNCPRCGKVLINMGTRWRAPKKRNDKAWRQINNGEIWWDLKALAKNINHYMRNYDNEHITKWFNRQRAERDGS